MKGLTISWTRPDSSSIVERMLRERIELTLTTVGEVRLVGQSRRIQHYCLARGRPAYNMSSVVDQSAG